MKLLRELVARKMAVVAGSPRRSMQLVTKCMNDLCSRFRKPSVTRHGDLWRVVDLSIKVLIVGVMTNCLGADAKKDNGYINEERLSEVTHSLYLYACYQQNQE